MPGIRVATVGDNCIDRYLALRQSTVGGNAVNVGVQLVRLGLAAAYFGAVGDDAAGVRVLAALRDNGIDTAHTRVSKGRTAYTDIAFGDGGDRIIAYEEMGVCAGYRPDVSEVDRLLRFSHVHIGWLDDGGAVKQSLAAGGTSVSQDLSVTSPAPGRRAEGLAVAFASAGPSVGEGETLAARLVAEGARIAVVTCGAAGSLAFDGAITARTDARLVEVVDTLGAGDTFIAGFLAARLGRGSLQSSLEAGRDLAAATCRHLGGFPQAPMMLA
jgi:fructoselysine 6-kinase